MKTLCLFIILMTFMIMSACKSGDQNKERLKQESRVFEVSPDVMKRYREELNLLHIGIEYPPLLTRDHAHSVSNKLTKIPTSLSETDLAEIYNIVARVPGLLSYEVLGITPSMLSTNAYEVYVPIYILRFKKEREWILYKINIYNR
jgi:hypothetical protein